MTNHVEATFEIQASQSCPLAITVRVVLFGGAQSNFEDQWQTTDKHQGGVTITNPDAGRKSYTYAIPLQCSLAELTASFAKQGRENPSREAYQSLQNQYARDAEAGDYGFSIDAELNGVQLVSDFIPGYGFDWCYLDEDDLETRARELIAESDITTLVLNEAKEKAAEMLSAQSSLTAFIEAE